MTTQFAMPEEELAALVAEVAQGINEITKKEAEKSASLRKSDEGSAGGEEGGESGGGESAGGPPAGGDAPPAADPSASAGAPPAGDPSASAGAPPADPAAGAAPADDGAGAAPSVEDLEHLYSQLPDDQLEAHFVAIQQAVAQRQGAGAGAGAPPDASAGAGAPPAGPSAGAPPPGAMPPGAGAPPPGAAPAGPSAGAPPAGPSAPPEDPAMKSMKGEIDTLKKSLELVTQALDKATVGSPMRKSVTRVEGNIVYVPYQGGEVAVQGGPAPMKKSLGEMTKNEVHQKLIEVTRDPKLSKSDRELINNYYDRKVGIEKLEKFFQ